MMDLFATVPYYTAYLCSALLASGTAVQVGSISYYLDPECFRSRDLRLDPGLLDVVGRFSKLPPALRRSLKLVEGLINLLALTVRFAFLPPGIVHVQFLSLVRSKFPVDLWFVRFCQWRGAKAVLTVHDLMPHNTGNRYNKLFCAVYAGMDALICHSDHVRSRLHAEFNVPLEKIAVIPHGPLFFDLRGDDPPQTLQSLGVKPGQDMVLWQGIISPYKGVDLLLNAWQHVEKEVTNACLVVLGTGDAEYTAFLREHALKVGLTRVQFHFRFCSSQELVAAYRAAALVVYPYRAITTSGALATGLALEKPIVASDLPVFRELLTDGVNALLADPNSPVDLSRCIVSLLLNPGLRLHFSSALANLNSGTEAWIRVAQQTSSEYSHLLKI